MKLDKRQKIIFGLVIVAIAILVWQMVSLFGGPSSPVSTQPKVQTITSLKEAASPTQVMQPAKPATKAEKSSSAPEISESQQQYLALVNEYQLVEIQRLIAQDQAAIAQARASMAESLAKMGQAGASGMGAGALASSIAAGNNQPGDYELIYTGQDNGEWSATLKRNGQFNDVTAGSVLPDGDKVLSVDDNGVLIQQGDVKKLVTFNGATIVNDKPADQSSTPDAAILQSQLQAPVDKTADKTKTSTAKTQVTTKTVTKSAAKTDTKTAPPVTLPPPVATIEKPVVLPKVVATNAPPVAAKANTGFDINDTNKRHYTIQVVSEADFKAVKAFVDKHHLNDKAQVLKVWRDGKPWYIAVMGEYSNTTAANSAIQDLPVGVCEEGPFARRIQDVQSEMVK